MKLYGSLEAGVAECGFVLLFAETVVELVGFVKVTATFDKFALELKFCCTREDELVSCVVLAGGFFRFSISE